MNTEIQIREVRESDLSSITKLSEQLGYSVPEEIVQQQIDKIISHPDHLAFVAVSHEQVLGYIHAFRALRFTAKPFLEIAGLVVSEEARRMSVGSTLVKYIESHLQENQLIRVRCNEQRKDAIAFYSKHNYNRTKSQEVFEK